MPTPHDTQGRHVIDWEFDSHWGGLKPKARCISSADSFCRSVPEYPECSCEVVFDIGRDFQGWYHVVTTVDDNDAEIRVKHRHHPSDECNIVNHLNEEPSDTILEACSSKWDFLIATTEITTTWAGEGVEWEPRLDSGDQGKNKQH